MINCSCLPHKIRRAASPFLLLALFLAAPGVASADTSNVSCDNLRATISSDKNYYVFTASASGNNNDISGYTFSFGDEQSYTVSFAASSTQNRQTVSVTHTYQDTGSYSPSVAIATKNGSKTTSVTSPSCQTNVTINSTSNSLPDTGAGDTSLLFAATCLAGTMLYELHLRHRHN
jgi:hypothetical protein